MWWSTGSLVWPPMSSDSQQSNLCGLLRVVMGQQSNLCGLLRVVMGQQSNLCGLICMVCVFISVVHKYVLCMYIDIVYACGVMDSRSSFKQVIQVSSYNRVGGSYCQVSRWEPGNPFKSICVSLHQNCPQVVSKVISVYCLKAYCLAK